MKAWTVATVIATPHDGNLQSVIFTVAKTRCEAMARAVAEAMRDVPECPDPRCPVTIPSINCKEVPADVVIAAADDLTPRTMADC